MNNVVKQNIAYNNKLINSMFFLSKTNNYYFLLTIPYHLVRGQSFFVQHGTYVIWKNLVSQLILNNCLVLFMDLLSTTSLLLQDFS